MEEQKETIQRVSRARMAGIEAEVAKHVMLGGVVHRKTAQPETEVHAYILQPRPGDWGHPAIICHAPAGSREADPQKGIEKQDAFAYAATIDERKFTLLVPRAKVYVMERTSTGAITKFKVAFDSYLALPRMEEILRYNKGVHRL